MCGASKFGSTWILVLVVACIGSTLHGCSDDPSNHIAGLSSKDYQVHAKALREIGTESIPLLRKAANQTPLDDPVRGRIASTLSLFGKDGVSVLLDLAAEHESVTPEVLALGAMPDEVLDFVQEGFVGASAELREAMVRAFVEVCHQNEVIDQAAAQRVAVLIGLYIDGMEDELMEPFVYALQRLEPATVERIIRNWAEIDDSIESVKRSVSLGGGLDLELDSN